jgi:hypothetical protein
VCKSPVTVGGAELALALGDDVLPLALALGLALADAGGLDADGVGLGVGLCMTGAGMPEWFVASARASPPAPLSSTTDRTDATKRRRIASWCPR